MASDRLQRWRLLLGKSSDPSSEVGLEGDLGQMDNILDALYDADRKGGLGSSSPNVNRWLGDIRKYFPTPVVQLMQKDALERLGLERMLLEPELLEAVVPDVHLVATLLSLNKALPAKTRETAKKVVRKVVEELEKQLRNPLREAIQGSLNRASRNRRPKLREMDWNTTIKANLKHYQPDLGTIIPEQFYGFGRKGQSLRHVILLIDQSGSMAESMVYSSVFGAIMASLRSLRTHLVVFDTAVIDLTDELNDPVDLLFCTQLGGGTDIGKALRYGETLITNPSDTIFVLISDLFEGGQEEELLRRAGAIKASGAQLITLLALGDDGAPAYDKNMAIQLGAMDIPAFACTPDLFPGLMAAAIAKESIWQWMGRSGIV
jgi:Mg-chelatase subunit ChlD